MPYPQCFCTRCVPTTLPLVCSQCGKEVRLGERGGQRDHWHRENVDHPAKLGHLLTEADAALLEAALDEPRWVKSPVPFLLTAFLCGINALGRALFLSLERPAKPYTTREFDFARMKKAAREQAQAEEEAAPTEPIPAPEVYSTPIVRGDARLPGGAKQVWNLAEKNGWAGSATYSRGPRVHSTLQTLLSVSDFVVLRLALDDQGLVAVGSWCDSKFDFAYVGQVDPKTKTIDPRKVDSKTLKSLIKGETP